VEWVKPIDEVEADFRRRGMFVLVDVTGRKLKFYGWNQIALRRAMDSLKGRTAEMAKFLTARAKGETA
jgi:hypothetical protein